MSLNRSLRAIRWHGGKRLSHPPCLARAQHSAARLSTETGSRDRLILVAGIVGGAALLYTAQQYAKSRKVLAEALPAISTTGERTISAYELGKHKGHDSCWLAIDGNVWDVTEFAQIHPGGSQILIDNGGRDVSKLFKGIHPAGTLEKNLDDNQRVGKLDAAAIAKFQEMYNSEEARIEKARETLFGVDSLVKLSDLEMYAKKVTPSAAWDYYSTGVENEAGKHLDLVLDRLLKWIQSSQGERSRV